MENFMLKKFIQGALLLIKLIKQLLIKFNLFLIPFHLFMPLFKTYLTSNRLLLGYFPSFLILKIISKTFLSYALKLIKKTIITTDAFIDVPEVISLHFI